MDGINGIYPWRLIMRTVKRVKAMNDISYSYTDAQVEGIVRYSVILGIIMGTIVSGAIMRFLG